MATNNKPAKKDDSIGALWKRTSFTGDKVYLNGNITIDGKLIKLVAFENKFKNEGSGQPDFRVYISKDLPPKKDGNTTQKLAAKPGPAKTPVKKSAPVPEPEVVANEWDTEDNENTEI